MKVSIERKLEINSWLIKARWFYSILIALLGATVHLYNNFYHGYVFRVTNNPEIFYYFITIIYLFFSLNLIFYFIAKYLKDNESEIIINVLSISQLATEIILYSIIIYFSGGVESFGIAFLFIPILVASYLFGHIGGIIVSLITSVILIIFVFLQFTFKNSLLIESIEFDEFNFYLMRALAISVFYIMGGLFSGYGSKLIFEHEKLLEQNTEKLNKEFELRKTEMNKLDKVAKLLKKRDTDLTIINKELDKKVKEIQKSKNSLVQAFKDVQKAGEEIEQERNKTLAIISGFTSPVIVLDKNDKVILFNEAAVKYLGIKFSDYGKKISSINNYSLENFKDIIRNEYTFVAESEPKGKNAILNEEIIIKNNIQDLTYNVVTVNIIGRDNEYLGVMKIFYDLTREKVLDKIKSEFISIAAHQLRTPLSATKWIMEMILKGDVGNISEEQKNLLQKSYKSNERIINLVDDLLNVSRIEEGRFGYNFKEQSLEEIIKSVLEISSSLIDKNHINLIINKPENLPNIKMDRDRIIMVMQNLLENAIKYTPQYGKIELNIKIIGEFIEIAVKDNGVGIPEKDKQKLFSKFFRASNVMRLQTEGSGLGLFICKNIIEKHGGAIKIKSQEGRGTEVIFNLPINSNN